MEHLTLEERKCEGAHYTPPELATFVAEQICKAFVLDGKQVNKLNILDPAVGDGELLNALFNSIREKSQSTIIGDAFDTDSIALLNAEKRINDQGIEKSFVKWINVDFIDHVMRHNDGKFGSLFQEFPAQQYDLVIANPPYVRTQVMGNKKSRELSSLFELKGRVDLFHGFLLAISNVLKEGGIAGVIVSNRFLSTQAGASLRRELLKRYEILHVWDFGDTKLFEAAVLPAVLLLRKRGDGGMSPEPQFTSIYSTESNPKPERSIANSIFDIIDCEGNLSLLNGNRFAVKQGTLNTGEAPGDTWRISNFSTDNWLEKVKQKTKLTFGEVGKVKVGVKTTADKVFIRTDWDSFEAEDCPELLYPLITHHSARRFKSVDISHSRMILYTHCVKDGKRLPVKLSDYPASQKYLETHRDRLEGRAYLRKAGREWFEIWVPHNPDLWKKPKIVFRDISKRPTFWIDFSGAVVNGDCYWISAEQSDEYLMWLALGVANSLFIEEFYDKCFNNKLYAGRRRFMTQYVEKFPLPDPGSDDARTIVGITRAIYDLVGKDDTGNLEALLDESVYKAFGL